MPTLLARGAAVFACAALAAHGQGTSRVEILGAPTPGAAASPSITVIRADELARAGVQTAEQAIRRIAPPTNPTRAWRKAWASSPVAWPKLTCAAWGRPRRWCY